MPNDESATSSPTSDQQIATIRLDSGLQSGKAIEEAIARIIRLSPTTAAFRFDFEGWTKPPQWVAPFLIAQAVEHGIGAIQLENLADSRASDWETTARRSGVTITDQLEAHLAANSDNLLETSRPRGLGLWIDVTYAGGIKGFPRSARSSHSWWLGVDETGVTVDAATGGAPRSEVHHWSWAAVRNIRVTQAGDKANIASLATFGVLAIGSRVKRNAIIVSNSDGPAMFLVTRSGPEQVHSIAERMVVNGAPPKKVLVGDAHPDGEHTDAPAQPSDIASQLERLAALVDAGHLTPDEFQSAKDTILRRG